MALLALSSVASACSSSPTAGPTRAPSSLPATVPLAPVVDGATSVTSTRAPAPGVTVGAAVEGAVVPSAAHSTVAGIASPTTVPPSTALATITPAATSTVAAPSKPCAANSTTITVDGRAVLVRVPASAGGAAVVIAVHGYKGTPEGLEHFSQLTDTGTATRAIVAYPSGSPLDLGFGWNSGAGRFATSTADDVGILSDLVATLVALPCANPAKVFIVGESNGGGLAVRAACDPRFAGRLAGVILANPAIDAGVLRTCATLAHAVPVLAVAGKLDKVVGYDGSRTPFLAAAVWFATLATSVARCGSGTPEHSAYSATVQVTTATGCSSCAALYLVADGPHTWPGSFAGENGAPPGTFPLTAIIGQVLRGTVGRCGY